ncbi:MAG TPA: hypothetical protein VHC18_14080 [Amycolatopsis sp.]|nr:hypothetical protein [Amycolatopsis sp.]
MFAALLFMSDDERPGDLVANQGDEPRRMGLGGVAGIGWRTRLRANGGRRSGARRPPFS